ncbi:MAG: hypothetical protein AABY22_19905 [Nanoarchaeota archaeon]
MQTCSIILSLLVLSVIILIEIGIIIIAFLTMCVVFVGGKNKSIKE